MGQQTPRPTSSTTVETLDENVKRKRVKNYFRDEGYIRAVVTILLGILLLIYVVGIVLIYLGVRSIVRLNTRPSEAQMDAWTAADVPKRVARALEISGIKRLARDPLEIRHAVSGPLLGDAESLQRLGDDNEWRYSPVGISVVLLADQQVCIYQCAIDLTTGVTINERVYEFFYQDVVDIGWINETQTIDYRKFGFVGRQVQRLFLNLNIDTKERKRIREMLLYVGRLQKQYAKFIVDKLFQRNLFTTFAISLENGTSIHVPVFDGRPSAEASHGLGADPHGARAALEVARAFIREKKLMLLGPLGARAQAAPLV